MIKTLLAGTVLSTGLFAGGVLGTEDVKKDEKVEKTKYTQTMESSTEEGKVKVTVADKDGNITYKEIDKSEIPKDAVPAQPNPGNQKYSETIEMPEGTESKPGYEIGNPEKPEYAETVDRPEGTDSKPGIELPTQDGEVEKAELDNSRPAPENPEDQPTKVERQPV